jgi:hypothetical protein
VIQYRWHTSNHRYDLSVAAPVIAQLIAWSGATHVDRSLLAFIEPRSVSAPGFIGWSFQRSILWIAVEERAVTIRIRDASTAIPIALDALPEAQPVHVELDRPCPHCHQLAEAYRILSDGTHVCPSCGRSFR